MPEKPQALFSQNLKTKGKTYFFDVRQAKTGNKYLTISETWLKDGQNKRSTITIFPDHLIEFSQLLTAMQEQLK